MNRKVRKIVYPILLLFTLYIVGGMVLSKRQEQIIFKPEKLKKEDVFKSSYPHKAFNITINETTRLSALYLHPDSAKGLVLYFHGNSGNIARFMPAYTPFLKHGYGVLTMDYPGFGKSTGEISEKAINEDARTLYQMATKYCAPDSILIYGSGLGGGVAAYLASRFPCRMLILQSPFYSLDAMAHHYFPIYPVAHSLRYHFPIYHYIQRTFAPVIIFHGQKDHTIPFSQAKRLSKLLSKKDAFIALPNASHDNVTQQVQYRRVMDSILR